jgi:hypothetical protein
MATKAEIIKYASFHVEKGVFDAYVWDSPMSDSYRVVIPVPDEVVNRHQTIEAQVDDEQTVAEADDGE